MKLALTSLLAVSALMIGVVSASAEAQSDTCADGIIYGATAPASGGYGTFVFCGGTFAELLDVSGCPQETSVFWFNKGDGHFAVWIPGSNVGAVNADLPELFFPEAVVDAEFGDIFAAEVPQGTVLISACQP